MLFLCTACNSNAQFQAELKQADDRCAGIGVGVRYIECSTEQGRPVFAKYTPEVMDLFEALMAKDAVIAEHYDNGDISRKEYDAETKQATVDFINAARARRASINEDQLQVLQAVHAMTPAPQPYVLPMPAPNPTINTNCYVLGNNVNCTSH